MLRNAVIVVNKCATHDGTAVWINPWWKLRDDAVALQRMLWN